MTEVLPDAFGPDDLDRVGGGAMSMASHDAVEVIIAKRDRRRADATARSTG